MLCWNPQDEAVLKDLWLQDLSAREIGLAMQRSRNSIIGKAHRLGLPMKKIKVSTKGQGDTPPRRAPKKTWKPSTGGTPTHRKPTIRDIILSSSAPTDHSHAVSILHAGADCCRAIIGCDSSDYALAVYCGAPVLEGKHFCPQHFVQFTQPARSDR